MLLTILVFAALAAGAVVLKLVLKFVAATAALSRQVPKRNEDFIFY